jgi:hypothetical protein
MKETPVYIEGATYEKLKKHLIITLPGSSYGIEIPLKTLVNAILTDWLEEKETEKQNNLP